MSNLSVDQKDALSLIVRSEDMGDGWRQCAPQIFNLICKVLPGELFESDFQTRRIRLTQEGAAVQKWL